MNIFCYLPSLLSVCKIVRISLESRTVGIWVLQWLCRQFPCSDTLTLSDPFLELSSEWEPATYLVNQCHHPHAWYSVAEGATNCSQFLLVFFAENVKLSCSSIFENFQHVSSNLSSCWLSFSCNAYYAMLTTMLAVLFFFFFFLPARFKIICNIWCPELVTELSVFSTTNSSGVIITNILHTYLIHGRWKWNVLLAAGISVRVVIHNHFQVFFCSTAINSSFSIVHSFPIARSTLWKFLSF